MNPLVSIALITKLKLIFETDAEGNPQPDKFLAFQNGAFPVSKENFYFMDPTKYNLGSIDTAIKMVDFANTFNFISAVDDFISPTTDELNDVYYDTIKNAIPANSSRTPDQEEQFEEAKEFLNKPVQTADGQSITVLANYSNYESQYKETLSEYKTRQLTFLNADGEDAVLIKEQFERDEPQLKNAISIALLNWETLGNREKVDKYLGQFMSLAGASPAKTIGDFKQEYELFANSNALDHLANVLKYIPTYFTPSNFFEDDVSWQTLSLDKAEVTLLVQKASPRLKHIFDMGDQNIDINNISFEYIVVDIVREWLHYKDFLLQRFWKQPDNQTPLSDGNGKGKLPALPEKIIFIRNVKIEAQTKAEPQVIKWNLISQLFQKVNPTIRDQEQEKMKRFENRKIATPFLRAALQKDSVFSSKPLSEIKPATTQKLMPHPSPVTRVGSSSLMLKKATSPPMMLRVAYQRSLISSNAIKPVRGFIMSGSSSHTTAPSQVTELKGMELLGFICQKVPLCANPDLSLKWDV